MILGYIFKIIKDILINYLLTWNALLNSAISKQSIYANNAKRYFVENLNKNLNKSISKRLIYAHLISPLKTGKINSKIFLCCSKSKAKKFGNLFRSLNNKKKKDMNKHYNWYKIF